MRFLSIDFLNTFLLTYRVFTDSETVLNALKKVFYDPPVDEPCDCESHADFLDIPGGEEGQYSPRRTSGASSVSGKFKEANLFSCVNSFSLGYCSEGPDRSWNTDSCGFKSKICKRIIHTQSTTEESSWNPEPKTNPKEQESEIITTITNADGKTNGQTDGYLSIPATSIGTSQSLDTLTESTLSGPSSPSNLSATTLVGSTGSGGMQDKQDNSTGNDSKPFKYGTAPVGPLPERVNPKNKDSSIVSHSLPPTVTTTQYHETSVTNAVESDERSNKPQTRHLSIVSGLQVQGNLSTDRRPSAGANVIPHAALCQHRHSLQLNGDTGSSNKV